MSSYATETGIYVTDISETCVRRLLTSWWTALLCVW